MWTHWICATQTGKKLVKVEPASGSFSRRMNGVGSGTHEFVSSSLGIGGTLAARRTSRLDLTRTWARTLVQCWDDKPVYAGLISGKSRKGDKVTLSTVEMREVFKYRTTFGLNGYSGFEDGKFEHKDQTLASIAGQLLWVLMVGPTDNWQLPLILPPRGMAGTQDRSYHDFNLPIVESEAHRHPGRRGRSGHRLRAVVVGGQHAAVDVPGRGPDREHPRVEPRRCGADADRLRVR